ncbi:MAG: peptide chain release factor N(5)-glutamine methyltransferase [Eubacteriales bacterium]|nr:peptide chain release factor N(5)-glutamine methyltransferase [Eubacteriales bacterium]
MEQLRNLETQLRPIAGEDSRFEARQLLGAARDDNQLRRWVARRLCGEPLQYILGQWEFYGLPMHVRPAALIPRADTETMCDEAIKRIKARGYSSVLDMCTGSGCVGIAIKKNAAVSVTMSDISADALALARENAQLNGVECKFVLGDMFCPIKDKFDCIVVNPPYLSAKDMATLQKEVEFEPKLALFGGEDGLEFYRRIANGYADYLNNGGVLLMEIGFNQSDAVMAMFEGATVCKDCGGINRVIIVEGSCDTEN